MTAPQTISVDTSSFKAFAKDLKKAEPALRKQLNKDLKVAGELVASEARSLAGFSTRLPALIKVGVARGAVRVYVRPPAAPHRREEFAFENRGRDGSFRHPVFGHRDRWVSQSAHPFLKPALLANRAAAVEAAKRAVKAAMEEIHSHG